MLFKRLKCKYHNINIKKMEELRKQWEYETYTKDKKYVGNVSYWYDKVKNAGFKVADTVIMPLSYDRYSWLRDRSYKGYKNLTLFSSEIIGYLKENDFDINRDLFISMVGCSNKYVYSWSEVSDIYNIGDLFYTMYDYSLLIGCKGSTELVISEYIRNEDVRPIICNGISLDTKFVVNYNFNTKRIEGVYNYWDKGINPTVLSKSDLSKYMGVKDKIAKEYKDNKVILEDEINSKMSKVDGMDGLWEIDFMYNGRFLYLVNMERKSSI